MNRFGPFSYNEGEEVFSLVYGGKIKIVDRYKENGYNYYRDEKNRIHREKDLGEKIIDNGLDSK